MKTLIFLAAGALAFAQAQKTFDSPEAAAQDLMDAATHNNVAELDAIFGARGKTLLSSGDPQKDQAERQEFATLAQDRHRLQQDSMDANRVILCVGSEDWPFPVPIVKKNGAWTFDSSMGSQAMKARRIGGDELDAIEICAGYAAAQLAYAQQQPVHDYAAHIAALGSLVPKEFVEATGANLKPYHGYYFRTLISQGPSAPGGAYRYLVTNAMMGGFALEAWPARYGVTGVHTFIVNQEGVVFEKDLGPATQAAPPVASYNPDATWTPVN